MAPDIISVSYLFRKDLTMRIARLSVLLVLFVSFVLLGGCVSEQQYKELKLKELKLQNNTQRDRIAELESRSQTTALELEKLQRALADAQSRGGIELNAMQQKAAALEEDLAKKKALIASMQQQLLYGGAVLPVELSTMLEDFAKGLEMITYDSNRGVVKFKSDLLFESGSDKVASSATGSIKSLCGIMNTDQGKQFDVIIAGHTDDMRIARADTRAKHPTNWHLSAHRAISVLDLMAANNIESERMSVRGFGEYRPVEQNKPGKKGNTQNRRVEIYIVAKGV